MWNNAVFAKPIELLLTHGLWLVAGGTWLFVFGYFARHKMFPSARTLWKIVLGLTIFLVLYGVVLSGLQYNLWSKAVPSKFLLPPHTPITYFLGYVWYHFFYRSVIAIVASFILGGMLWFMNQDFENRFMEPYEIPLFVLGGLIAGWPYFLVYLLGGLLFALILGIILRVTRGTERVSLALPFFLAAGIALAIGDILAPLLFLDRIQI